jgi:hypothetical protein
MNGSNVTIKVKAVKGTGFMPEAGSISAFKSVDSEGITSYKIAESVPVFGGQIVRESVVEEV